MVASALVQTRIDPEVKEKAASVLENMGLTVSDAVRIMLTRTANEGSLPFDPASSVIAHDRWFREKMMEALAELDAGNVPVISEAEWKGIAKRKRAELKKLIRDTGNEKMRLDRVSAYHRDLERIVDYIAQQNPSAALTMWDEIEQRVQRLAEHPFMGRPGRIEGTRELVITRTPFVVGYSVRGDTVYLLRVLHGAQRWPR